ncbi:unnamed protein product [Ectocarpus sp. 4 AP-2014]
MGEYTCGMSGCMLLILICLKVDSDWHTFILLQTAILFACGARRAQRTSRQMALFAWKFFRQNNSEERHLCGGATTVKLAHLGADVGSEGVLRPRQFRQYDRHDEFAAS